MRNCFWCLLVFFYFTIKPLFGKWTCNFNSESRNKEDRRRRMEQSHGVLPSCSCNVISYLSKEPFSSKTQYIKGTLRYSIYNYNKSFYILILSQHNPCICKHFNETLTIKNWEQLNTLVTLKVTKAVYKPYFQHLYCSKISQNDSLCSWENVLCHWILHGWTWKTCQQALLPGWYLNSMCENTNMMCNASLPKQWDTELSLFVLLPTLWA